jgi:hypothetical protein
MTGFSPGNLRRMRRLVDAYPLTDKDLEIWSRLLAKSETSGEAYPIPADLPDLPWGHLIDLIAKVADRPTRAWYAAAGIEHRWSRDVLGLQIASRLHEREGKAITNFARTLPAPQSDLAQAATRDPFTFGGQAESRGKIRGLSPMTRSGLHPGFRPRDQTAGRKEAR